MAAGALDVYTIPIGMKKGRQALQLCCMCREEQLENMKKLLFRHTTTWGMRINRSRRFVLERQTETVETPHGPIRIKYAEFDGLRKAKASYGRTMKIISEGLQLIQEHLAEQKEDREQYYLDLAKGIVPTETEETLPAETESAA